MTSTAPDATPGRWLTAAEVARASELREDLVERFLPAMEPPEALYSGDLVAIARFVKELTDLGTPAPAIEVAVAELRGRPDAAFSVALGNGSRRAAFGANRVRTWATVGATAVTALIVGGVVGGFVGLGNNSENTATAPAAVAKAIPAEASTPKVKDVNAVTGKPDPVCAEWGKLAGSYGAKQHAWSKLDPRVPASKWSPKHRSVTLAVIPVMREEAATLRRLAGKAADPVLAGLMKRQAVYEDTYANRLPKYQPDDHDYWKKAAALGGTVKALCAR